MFQGMKYVYEVYKEMSFSKAAKNLYISQPSLSAAVKKEEASIGFPIFDRSTNPIQLTELGKEYIRSVELIMDVENGFRNYINEMNDLEVGTLRLGATNLFASYVLPPLLSRYTELYPSIQIELVEGTTSELTELLANGSLDLLIDNKAMDESLYEKIEFYQEVLLLTVPKHYPCNTALHNYALTADDIKNNVHLSSRILPVSLKSFKDVPFLLLASGNDTRRRANHMCRDEHFSPIIRIEPKQQITAYNMSSYGMGISFCGDSLIRHVPSDPGLLFYKLKSSEAIRAVNFYYRKNRYLTGQMKAFLNLVKGSFIIEKPR